MTSLGFIIVGAFPLPLPPPILKGDVWEVQNFLLERGDKPGKGGGVDIEIGGIDNFLLLYSSVIFTVCEGKVRFALLLFGSSVF